MKFTIIVPVYKQQKFLRRCLDSVLWQMESEDQLILVDDGNDPPIHVPPHFTIYNGVNRGVSYSRNAAVKACPLPASDGEWLKFLDADDILAPYALHTVRKTKFAPHVQVISGMMLHVVDDVFRAACTPNFSTMKTRNPTAVSNSFIRRLAFDAVGGFDERIAFEEDWDLWLKIDQKFSRSAFHVIRVPICYYWGTLLEKKVRNVNVEGMHVREYFRKTYGCTPEKNEVNNAN